MRKVIMFSLFVWPSQLLVTTTVNGSDIAMNFADDDTTEAFSGRESIGPTGIDSNYWNSSIDRDFESLAAGTKRNLMHDSGVKTTVTVVWKAKNSSRIESERTDTDEQKLARSYLDDGGGNLATVAAADVWSRIPRRLPAPDGRATPPAPHGRKYAG